MTTAFGEYAAELVALVRRAARLGRLDPYELLETYAELAPSSHPALANPRQVDLSALTSALTLLPAAIVSTPRVLVVPRLSAFSHRPLASVAGAAGVLEDGTVLIEGRYGLLSLIGIAAALCAVAHELDKARTLGPPSEEELLGASSGANAAAELVQIGGHRKAATASSVADETGEVVEDEDEDGDGDGGDGEAMRDAGAGPDAGIDAGVRAGAGSDEGADGSENIPGGGMPGETAAEMATTPAAALAPATATATVKVKVTAATAGGAPDCGATGDLASMAFALGVDESQLRSADSESGGRLLAVLEPTWDLPPVAVHADFDVVPCRERARARGARMAASVAEMGLAGRELHLWVGGGHVSDCLSPYARELRAPILEWAASHPELVGEDIAAGVGTGARAGASEDLLYVLSSDFLASDVRLADERAAADRTVGILRYEVDGLPFDIIDLSRLEPEVTDPRLGAWQALEGGPVLLRVAVDLEDSTGVGLTTLMSALAPQLASVTVALEGSALEHAAGTIIAPTAALTWAGEHLVDLPGAEPIAARELAERGANVISGGVIVSAPCPSLLSHQHLSELHERYQVQAIDIGGAGVLSACAEMRLGVAATRATAMRWALVASRYTARGRPDLASIAGQTALSLHLLRRWLGRPAPHAAPERQTPPRPASSGSRKIRLKA